MPNGTVLSGYSVDVENRLHRSHGRDGPRSLIVRADGALKTVPFGSGGGSRADGFQPFHVLVLLSVIIRVI